MHTMTKTSALKKKFYRRVADVLTPTVHDYDLWERKNTWLRRAGINIGQHSAIDRGFDCLVGNEENLFIQDHCAIGIGCHLWNFNTIKIGKFCMFAAGVTLANGGHHTDTFEPFSGPLTIGNGCWIGLGVKIIGPITIGNNVIIGAGTVVVEDVPDSSIVVGVPGRVIKQRNLPKKVWHLGNVYFDPITFDVIN